MAQLSEVIHGVKAALSHRVEFHHSGVGARACENQSCIVFDAFYLGCKGETALRASNEPMLEEGLIFGINDLGNADISRSWLMTQFTLFEEIFAGVAGLGKYLGFEAL